MANYIKLPDGSFFPVKEGETYVTAMQAAYQKYPEAFGGESTEAPKKRPGFFESVGQGAEQLFSSQRTGLASLTGGNEAAEAGIERQKAIKASYGEQPGWTEVTKAYEEKGLPSAIGEYLRQIPNALAQQAPQIAESAAAARAAGIATKSPYGALAGAFGPSFAQQYGDFLEAQAEEQRKKGEPVDVNRFKAAAFAIPAAGLDVATMLIPMGRSIAKAIFGPNIEKLLTRGATAEAEKLAAAKLADEGFLKTLGKGTAKGVAFEIPTEVTQQFLQRAQAGQSLFDEEAFADYGNTAFEVSKLGLLGGAGRFADKSAARTQIKAEDTERDKQTKAAARLQATQEAEALAKAEEIKKNSSQYALDVDSRLEAVKKQIKELDVAGSVTVAEGDIAAEAAKKEAQKAKKDLRNSDETKALIKEWNTLKPRILAAREEQRVSGMSPEEYALEQAAQQKQISGKQRITPTEVGAEDPFATPPTDAAKYAQDRIGLAKQQVPERVAMATEKDTKKQDLSVYIDYLMADPYMAGQLVKTRTPLPLLVAPRKDLEKQAIAQKKAEEIVYGGLNLQLEEMRLQKAAKTAQPNQQRLGVLEEQEQATIEASRAAEARAAEDAALRERMTPEMQALQRIKRAPSPMTENLGLFGNKEAPPTSSAAFGQLQQRLQGIPLEKGTLPTAEEVVPAEEAKRVVTREPAKEFRLYPRSEKSGAPITPENLKGRINRALSVFDLSPEAEAFLRRAEQVIPQADTTLKQATSEVTDQGTRQNVSESQGFLTLLDQQLTKIESGAEGVPRKGAGRPVNLQTFPPTKQTQAQVSTTTPTKEFKKDVDSITGVVPGQAASVSQTEMFAQRERLERTGKPGKLPGFVAQPEEDKRTQGVPGRAKVEKRGQDINEPVYRIDPVTGKRKLVSGTIRGKGVEAVPLSLQAELEPLVRLSETVRDEQAGQLPLFGAADERSRVQKAERRGIEAGPSLDIGARPDVEAFQRFINSPYVRKLKQDMKQSDKNLAPVRAFLSRALPRLKQMLKDSKATTVRMSKIKNWTKFLKENQELTAFQTNTENMVLKMNNLKLDASDINGRIRAYEQAKDDLIKESNRVGVRARGGAPEIKLFKELDDLLALYQEAKAELVQTKGALDLVRTQIKVLVGEQRLAELKATTDPLAKSNAAAQDEIKRLQEAVRTAQAEVGEAETKERQTAADKAQAVKGAKVGSVQQLEQQISDERARRWNVAMSGFGDRSEATYEKSAADPDTGAAFLRTYPTYDLYKAEKSVQVRALSAAEQDARERGLTADAASEVKYKNDLYNKPLLSLVLELGNIDKQLTEAATKVTAARKKSGSYVGGEQNVQAFKGMGAAIRLQSRLSVRKETLENAINFMRARNVPLRKTLGAEPEVRAASIEEQDTLDQYIDQVQELGKATDRLAALTIQRDDAIKEGKTKTVERLNGQIDAVNTEINTGTADKARLAVALQGRVSAGARQTTSAPAKFRTGTDESKRNVGSVRQPLVEQRTIKSPTVKQAVAEANAYAEKIRAGQKELTTAQEAAIEAERQAEFQYILERREAELTTKLDESTKELERFKAIQERLKLQKNRITRKDYRETVALPSEQEITNLAAEIKSFTKELASVKRELVEQMRKMYRNDTSIVAEEVEAPEPKPRGRPRKITEEEVYGEDTRKTSAMEDVYNPREGEEYARGVESTSPDLTAAQVRALEDNDLRAAFIDMANDPATSQVNRAVAQRLADMLDDTSVSIQSQVTDENGKAVLGSATSRRISLSRNGGLSQEILLHEGTHAAVERVLQMDESKLTKQQLVAKRELQALYAAVKNDPKITSASAKGSLSEFAAEVMSNRTLQQQLQSKKWRLSDAWAGFKSIIMRLLGVERPETMFGAALQSVDALMIPSSVRTAGVERTVSRKLAQKDIAALHTGSNSMKQFAEQFGPEIKQKDRTAEDADRIGKAVLDNMGLYPSQYISGVDEDKLSKNTKIIMSDGKPFDEDNPLHYVEADAQTYINLAIKEGSNLGNMLAEQITDKRRKDLSELVYDLLNTPEYTYVEQALVAKAASKYAVLSDKTGRLKLAEIGKDNTHNLAFISSKDAGEVIRKLREGLPLKQAFLAGMQEMADRNAENNAKKDGWQKFDQHLLPERPEVRVRLMTPEDMTFSGMRFEMKRADNPNLFERNGQPVDRAELSAELQAIWEKEIFERGARRGPVRAPARVLARPARVPARPVNLGEQLRQIANAVNAGEARPRTFADLFDEEVKPNAVRVLKLTNEQADVLEMENARLEIEGEPKLTTIDETAKFLDSYYTEIYANAKDIQKAAEELNAGAANTSWCTGGDVQTAKGHIEQGDFYIYYKNGKPEVAVRMDGKTSVGEVRGNTESQGLTNEQELIAKDFLSSKKFTGSKQYIDTLERKQALTSILKGEKDFDVPFLMKLGSYVDSSTGDANPYAIKRLLDFSAIDGENFVERPEPTDAVIAAVGKKLNESTEAAIKEGHFLGTRGFVSGSTFHYYIQDTYFEVPADSVRTADSIHFINNAVYLPNLETLNVANISGNAVVHLPKVRNVAVVRFGGEDRTKPVLVLADNAVINSVEVTDNYEETSLVRLNATIKNATVVTSIEVNADFTAIDLSLPDTIYAPEMTPKARERAVADGNSMQFYGLIQELDKKHELKNIQFDADDKIVKTLRKATKEALGQQAVNYADGDTNQDETTMYEWLWSVREALELQHVSPKADIFKIAKKVNAAFDIETVAPEEKLIDSRSQLGTVDIPNRIADQPPVLEMIEPEETPRYARAAQYGEENALVDLAKDIMSKKKTWKEQLGTKPFLQAEMELVDMRAGLREALKAGAKEIGDDMLFTQAMSHIVMADQKMAMLNASLQKGPMELYTDEKGFKGVRSIDKDNALDVFKSVADIPMGDPEAKANIATTYMIAQRAMNKGVAKLDLGALGVTEEKLKAALAAANADSKLKNALEATRSAYNAYNEGQIKFLASTGAITKAEADRLLKEGDFIPFYRVNENGMAQLVFSDEVTVTIGDIRRQPYLKELVGGETRILPITETLQRNSLLIMDKALTNLATKNLAYAFQKIGEGKGPVGKDGKPTSAMPIHIGMGPASPDVIRFNQEPNPDKPDDKGERWLRVKTSDTVMGGIPAELIVKSLEGAHLTLPAFLKIGGIAGDILRSGVTRMPIYIARQLVRDPMAAAFTGGLDYNPLTAVVKAGKEFVASSRGQSPINEEMIKKGLIQSGIFTGDPDDVAKMALQLASGKDQSVLDKVFAATDRYAMRADAATRALVYENARRNGLSEVEADLAVRESMNFYKRGLSPTVQYASRLIPFFNAQIQGLNVLYKAARGQMPFEEQMQIQQKFFNNALLLVATGIVYAMAMDDDEYYKNAKPKDRYTNFFLHLPGVDEPLKLPIPYEAGWFFSLAVAASDAMKAEVDGVQQLEALRDMFLQSVPGYSSRGVPQIFKPAFEVYSNKRFFNDSAIESARMEKLSPQQRFSETTTEAAKMLSKVLPGFSPVQIEHLATGYFGQLPLIVMGAADGLFRKKTRGEPAEKRVSDLPFIGSSFQKKYGGADSDVMYRMASESMQAKATFDDMRKKGQGQEARDFLEDNRALVASAALARNYQNVMGKLRTDVDRINNMKNMTGAEKRARLDKIDAARQDVADKFEKAMKRIEASGKT